MSITLNPQNFDSEGSYIEAISSEFLKHTTPNIISFAEKTLREGQRHGLDTALVALVWTVQDRKTDTWKALRALSWKTALGRYPMDKCGMMFVGLPG